MNNIIFFTCYIKWLHYTHMPWLTFHLFTQFSQFTRIGVIKICITLNYLCFFFHDLLYFRSTLYSYMYAYAHLRYYACFNIPRRNTSAFSYEIFVLAVSDLWSDAILRLNHVATRSVDTGWPRVYIDLPHTCPSISRPHSYLLTEGTGERKWPGTRLYVRLKQQVRETSIM